MIRAEHADRIMQQYESDYDNFLDKLKAKRKAKKAQAALKKGYADKADKTVAEAEAHKKVHLGQKAKDLLDKAGGIEGAKDTIQNVLKYVKGDGAAADYEVGVGKDAVDPTEKKLFGLPPMVVYVGGVLIFLAGVYAVSKMKKTNDAASKPLAAVSQVPPATPVSATPTPTVQ
jgi:hypothetical protein